ncbi:MAG: undecaprenyldiphospho-muramoylpentapeptide beta-N-acetylglucosaminyltransferase [Endomicrobiia bacterium]|nr:undecaprenyldiphospho-muramoylpentapeptide beta-N-acetylglucosaminyltransferase [Endomicrobiaceae bacterium]MDD3052785.1 undecaprenyldiphospho-muramoylpentapeptide beta-N-acetylglucosaminyltransferase [Endomicrobiaceae bacterium]MDD3921917.1 undecaprenyldiphospho-muramoylpentapeptide beta-N-acetylglucosaminyltransferase [Endomicrobiaceae bacterium]
MTNIMIVVSGTGGHVYPGIALAHELKQIGFEPVFVVNNNVNAVSVKIVTNSGFNYELLNFSAPSRKISLNLFLFPFTLLKSLFLSNRLLNKISPKVVVGMGAYLSFPVLFVAKLKNIPTLIHEQNSFPGLANRILSKFVDKVAISFIESLKYFNKSKVIDTSNPVRKDIFNISRQDASEKLNLDSEVFTVFVFGGSLGATKLNNIMIDVADKLYQKYQNKIQFIHIVGNKDFDNINRKYKNIKYKKYIAEYMNDIGNAYACSDILVCRAGAGTVKEVEMYGLSAIFIPYPYATDNHQYFNAKSIEEKGFREIIEEKDLTEKTIIEFIEKNINNTIIDKKRVILPQVYPQEKLAQEVIKLIK